MNYFDVDFWGVEDKNKIDELTESTFDKRINQVPLYHNLNSKTENLSLPTGRKKLETRGTENSQASMNSARIDNMPL